MSQFCPVPVVPNKQLGLRVVSHVSCSLAGQQHAPAGTQIVQENGAREGGWLRFVGSRGPLPQGQRGLCRAAWGQHLDKEKGRPGGGARAGWGGVGHRDRQVGAGLQPPGRPPARQGARPVPAEPVRCPGALGLRVPLLHRGWKLPQPLVPSGASSPLPAGVQRSRAGVRAPRSPRRADRGCASRGSPAPAGHASFSELLALSSWGWEHLCVNQQGPAARAAAGVRASALPLCLCARLGGGGGLARTAWCCLAASRREPSWGRARRPREMWVRRKSLCV